VSADHGSTERGEITSRATGIELEMVQRPEKLHRGGLVMRGGLDYHLQIETWGSGHKPCICLRAKGRRGWAQGVPERTEGREGGVGARECAGRETQRGSGRRPCI
jgi:hypothetical protein